MQPPQQRRFVYIGAEFLNTNHNKKKIRKVRLKSIKQEIRMSEMDPFRIVLSLK